MKRLLTTHRAAAIVSAVVFAALSVYLSHAWLRQHAFPTLARLATYNSISANMRVSATRLQRIDLLAELTPDAPHSVTCSLDRAAGLATAAACESHITARLTVTEARTKLSEAAEELKSQGWTVVAFDRPAISSTTDASNVQLYALNDYGSVHCSLSIYMRPKDVPGQGATTLYCYRLVSVF
jgi:hypothetical protein